MPAGLYNITIEKGSKLARVITWTAGSPAAAVNLTGWTARMQIREKVASSTVALELTTENGRIILGGIAGTITLYVSAVDTAAITIKAGVYDLEMIPPSGANNAERFLEGKVKIKPEVTR